jgi:hypothetical protein
MVAPEPTKTAPTEVSVAIVPASIAAKGCEAERSARSTVVALPRSPESHFRVVMATAKSIIAPPRTVKVVMGSFSRTMPPITLTIGIR